MKKSLFPVTLETERLIIRPYKEDDLAGLFAQLSDPEVVRFEPYATMTVEETKEELANRMSTNEYLAIEEKSTHSYIGNAYVGERSCNSYEIGYVLIKEKWGKGYAFEAMKEILDYLYRNLVHRVEGCCDPKNERSWKLLEKIGLTKEAHLRQNTYFFCDKEGNPIWKDTLIYGGLNPLLSEPVNLHGKSYKIERLLGKGKGGYSYLASSNGERVVYKKLHHEPCSYYQFGNKIEAELRDYRTLVDCGVPMPRLIDYSRKEEALIKEYLPGKTIAEMVEEGENVDCYIGQVSEIANKLQASNINIDYYPTNFIVKDGKVHYVDYECNLYDPKWNFENWGMQYWRK